MEPRTSEEQDALACSACSASIDRCVTIKCEAEGPYFGNRVSFMECDSCGFVFAPGNVHVYNSKDDFCQSSRPLQASTRVGTDSRPGREYFMATMAIDMLLGAGLIPNRILIYGCGLSMDHLLLARERPDIGVYICDLMNFQGAERFVGLEDASKFDVVIACEVVEHFTDVQGDFSSLLSKLSDNGIAVLSTNVRTGAPLSRFAYPFIPGHTAYYSGRALELIAKRFDARFQIDFRVPQAALAHLGPTKRYVLLYRNSQIAPAIAGYFSQHFMAPSESPVRMSFPAKVWRWLRRKWRRGLRGLPRCW